MTTPTATGYSSQVKSRTLLAMILTSGIVFLDATVINVALPAIDRDLKLGLSGLQWIVEGYVLALAAFLIPGGSLGDRYGRKKAMSWGLAGFGVTSVACGLAPGTEWLVAARILQGIAGAFLIPGSLAVLRAVYTVDEERGRAIGNWAGWSGIMTVIGPFAGGWLVDSLSWRWIFFINVPVAALAGWLVLTFVPESYDRQDARGLDWPGALLTIAGLGGITYALVEGPVSGWTAPGVLAGLAGGFISLVALVAVEARTPQPMLPLGLFRSRNFSATNLVTLGVYFALAGSGFFISLYIQNIMRYPALVSGIIFVPVSLFMLVLSPRFGRLSGRYGPRWFMAVGPLIYGAGLLALLALQPDSNLWLVVVPAACLMGLGLSVTVAPLTSTVMASVPEQNAGIASAVNNVVTRVANLLAIAGLGVVLSLSFQAIMQQKADTLSAPAAAAVRELAADTSGAAIYRQENQPPEARRAALQAYTEAFHRVMLCCALLAWSGGLLAALFIRNPARTIQTG